MRIEDVTDEFESAMEVIYENGKLLKEYTFEEVRNNTKQ